MRGARQFVASRGELGDPLRTTRLGPTVPDLGAEATGHGVRVEDGCY